MSFNKKEQAITMSEEQFREIVGIIRDESRWGDYITIIKNHDGTRTVRPKKKIDLRLALGLLGVA